jgi:Leucine-rich repeat (LRR) protein
MPSLKVLPRQLGKMKKLSVLRLECSASLKLPSRFRKLSLSRLQFICTDSAESTSVSAVRKYNKLKGLEINAVTFGAFPEWIYEMDALEYLGLVHGNLTEIPTSINKMKGLKTIQFGKNALIALPKEFGELKLLAYVDLSNNNFAEFPVVLLELTELYDIDLSGNKIKTIPENITVLRKLISLDLRNNPISVEEQERIRQLLPDVRVYFN